MSDPVPTTTNERAEMLVEMQALAAEVRRLKRERGKLRGAIRWALGEGRSDFGDNVQPNAPRYWWRAELRRRAGL
jgi:hypothetical protein